MAYTHDKANYINNNPFKLYSNASLNEEKPAEIAVNHTIKPIDRELATAEIERNEVVFKPTGELYRALGNRHRKGSKSGTPVNLPEGSFIFSDHKPLAFKKEDKELFEFKVGGKVKNSTPAKTLQKEVDLEHHNRMIAIQGSNDHDAISKTSAQLMLQKNVKKIGQVAYLQEEYKGFPDGLPTFSQGTASIEDPQQEVMQQQYQEGGFTQLPQYQLAGKVWAGDRYGNRRKGTPTSNGTRYSQNQWNSFAKDLGFQGSPLEFQSFLHKDPRFKGLIDDLHLEKRPGPNKGMFDGNIGYRWDAIYKAGNQPPVGREIDRTLPTVTPVGNPMQPNFPNTTTAPEIPDEDILPYEPNVGLNNLQKFSLANSAYNLASAERFDPKRQQVGFTPLTLEKINSQPYMNAINNQTQQAYKANAVMNPIIARASNSNTYGRGLEQVSDVLGKIDNQNIQISNQENMYNNQGINRTNAQNVSLDGRYYDQVTAAKDNYKTETGFLRNRFMDEYKGYRNENKDLELKLASQPTYGTVDVYQDPTTGETSRTPKPGWIKKRQAAPLFDYNSKKNRVYFTGAGMNIDQIPSQGGNNLLFRQLDKKMSSGEALTGPEILAYERMTRTKK